MARQFLHCERSPFFGRILTRATSHSTYVAASTSASAGPSKVREAVRLESRAHTKSAQVAPSSTASLKVVAALYRSYRSKVLPLVLGFACSNRRRQLSALAIWSKRFLSASIDIGSMGLPSASFSTSNSPG